MARELTDAQKDDLIAQYSQLVIDSMDVESLEQFVYNTLKDDFTALSNSELQDEIKYSFDEETLDELVDNVTNNCIQTFIPGFHDQRSITMKWAVKLYVAGKLFEEKVHAVNYQDAKETALARNPKAKVVSVNPTFKDD